MNELVLVLQKVLPEDYVVVLEGGIVTVLRVSASEDRCDRHIEFHFRPDKEQIFFIEAENVDGSSITI